MSKPETAAAPTSGIPKFAELLADPEIAALLDFKPAVRKTKRPNGWSPGLQRELIARIAHCGSPGVAADQMDKNPTGAKQLYRTEGADSFRAAWDAAMSLAEARDRSRRESGPGRPSAVPGMPNRRVGPQRAGRARPGPWSQPLAPGQVYNENGLPEDEASFRRRGEEARESIAAKLLRCRRALLAEIARDPGKRAAFELLTDLPIDWDKAARLEPQADEPWRTPRMLEPDMVVTAENGWFGTIVPDYGPDKVGELRKAVNQARRERGLEPIESWSEDVRESASGPNDGKDDEDSVLHSWAAEHSEPAQPDNRPSGPPAPRSFGLNSPEAYEALTDGESRPWIPNGALPREPRLRDPEPVLRTGPRLGRGRGK